MTFWRDYVSPIKVESAVLEATVVPRDAEHLVNPDLVLARPHRDTELIACARGT